MSKQNVRTAKRYARALFEVLHPDELETCHAAVSSLAKIWEQGGELKTAMNNPALPLEARISAVQEIGNRLVPGKPAFTNFLAVLLRNGRMELLPEVSILLREMIDSYKKLLALEITSAFPLDDSERGDMQNKIREQLGSTASIAWKVDPALIGGLIVKYGDRVLDTSVKGTLQNLRSTLVG